MAIILLYILFGANAVAIKVAYQGFGVFSASVICFSLVAMTLHSVVFIMPLVGLVLSGGLLNEPLSPISGWR